MQGSEESAARPRIELVFKARSLSRRGCCQGLFLAQPAQHPPECRSAMTVLPFRFRGKLRETPPKRRKEEQRIVTKPSRARRPVKNKTSGFTPEGF